MNVVAKGLVSTVTSAVIALACSNTPAVPQAGVISNVQPIPTMSQACNVDGPFISIGDPNDNSKIIETGTSDYVISCSVIPSGNGYQVQANAQITGGINAGQLTFSGLFVPRTRDANGNPTADTTLVMPNILAIFQDATKELRESDCTAQYLTVVNGEPGVSLPSSPCSTSPCAAGDLGGGADVFADNNGGRLWVSIFCPNAMNIKTDNQGLTACEASATVRFENCTSKATN